MKRRDLDRKDAIDSVGGRIWLQFGLLGFVERLELPPAARTDGMSPRVTACQHRASAGKNGDVGYRWIPFPAPIGLDYRSAGMDGPVYYASITRLSDYIFSGDC